MAFKDIKPYHIESMPHHRFNQVSGSKISEKVEIWVAKSTKWH
jgi:hypothetical protein